MLRKIFTACFAMSSFVAANAQDSATAAEPPKPTITGSLDVYYRYNFQDPKSGSFNNWTSFTNSQNSFELGMASIRADHSFGKASATIDLGFGRRAEEFSYTDGEASSDKNGFFSLANVKQAYLSYAVSDKFKLTMGKFATHVGYELVDAYLNRNYSMSYMFSYGPFFHTGLKADISLGGTSALMVGVSNPTDFSAMPFPSTAKFVIAQFSTGTSNGKLKAFLNYQGGKYNIGSTLNQVDLVVTGAVSDKFSIGYNGTVQSRKPAGGSSDSWWGSALYFNFDPVSTFGLTLRTEYVDDKKDVLGYFNSSVFATTLSGNIKAGNLTIIPELRLDSANEEIFEKSGGEGTKSAFTALLAATYRF
ncbi:outer membrane beta-barrel protein [Foetidibacter luteolus]|uniref:outer membrane beta-barrel protein n=1 Tax=Foetidibacter luteolus TaxID=2608880 RepID=UPI00129AB8C3|nr:outer membrane beta-barrel protein [Foetidibacter luteolus]